MSLAATGDVNLRMIDPVDNCRQLLALIAPPRCLFCGLRPHAAAVNTVEGCCPGCRRDLPWNLEACPGCALPSAGAQRCRRCRERPARFDRAWTAFDLAEPVHASLLGLKYRARFADGRVLAQLMAQALRDDGRVLPDCLLPVPLHWSRLMRRGYNQAQRITRVLSAELGVPMDESLLRRRRRGRDQIGQSAAARRANLRGVFEARGSLQGRRIALVDDVMTTGATFDELARVCRRAGAVDIEVWAVARTRLA